MRDSLDEFRSYNRPFARRNPELIRHKIARMADSPFAFFRGTFHLFARDVLDSGGGPLPLLTGQGPELDLVGDVHSENFGTFKTEDGLVHYDVNDFDETTTGRFDFDVCRLSTSLFLASRDLKENLDRSVLTALTAVTAYSGMLRRLLSRAKIPEPDVREGVSCGCAILDDLVRTQAAAKRGSFITRLTEMVKGKRRLVRSARYYNLSEAENEQARRLVEDYRKRQSGLPDKADYFQVEDVCGRISGIGSMGRFRYVVLLAGKGSADARNVLLEFKESRPSAYDLYRKREQDPGALTRRAERVLAVQRASQASGNRFLGFALDGEQSFQVRQLGPHDDRLESKALRAAGLLEVARVQGEILARIHARAAGRAVGPANPLAEMLDPDAYCQQVLAFALGYADVVRRDHARFVGARADLDRVESWMGE